MAGRLSLLSKVFTPAMISKAMRTFDKATMVIVSTSWGVALTVMVFALYTVSLSVSAKRQALEAAAMEPVLPKLVPKAPEVSEINPIVERMKRRFSEINFTLGSDHSLTVTALDGSRFRSWLTVLSYIDTVSPQYRWQIKELCVGGTCPGGVPMKAVLMAQKIIFTTPPPPAK